MVKNKEEWGNLSSTEISTVCRQNVRLWKVGMHFCLFRIAAALSTFPLLWYGWSSVCVMSFEGACHSDMRNVMRRKQLNLAWHYPPRGKYDSRVENWSMSPNFPAASAWQMTLLSLSWVANVGRLNSEDNRFMWYCFNDSLCGKITAAAFKTRGADSPTFLCRGDKARLSSSLEVHTETIHEWKPVIYVSHKQWTDFQDSIFLSLILNFFFISLTTNILCYMNSKLTPLCIMCKTIKLKANSALFFLTKEHSVKVVQYQVAPWSGLCISVLSPCPIDSPPGCPRSVIWQNTPPK